jgi:hypothetical protein
MTGVAVAELQVTALLVEQPRPDQLLSRHRGVETVKREPGQDDYFQLKVVAYQAPRSAVTG